MEDGGILGLEGSLRWEDGYAVMCFRVVSSHSRIATQAQGAGWHDQPSIRLKG